MTDAKPIRVATERFVRFVMPEPNSGCHLWTGAANQCGYGRFYNAGRLMPAHHYAWEVENGKPVPVGMLVCHRCDVPSCVNPAHLFVGTHADNMSDRDTKQRLPRGDRHHARRRPETMARGERNGAAKLTAEQARSIREDNRYQRVIAADYGVSQSCISAIKLRQAWRHL